MKQFLGLKAKANSAVRSGMERVSSSKNMASNPTLGDKSFTSRAERPTAEADAASGESPDRPKQGANAVDPVIASLLSKARSDTVREQFLSVPPEQYTETHTVKLLAGTYNVNGRKPPVGIDLRTWLDVSKSEPDIVAVGFQEVVPLNAGNVVMGGSLESAAAWDQLIDSALNTRGVFGTVEDGHLIIRSTSSQLASMQRVSSVRSNGNAALGPDLIDLSENSPASERPPERSNTVSSDASGLAGSHSRQPSASGRSTRDSVGGDDEGYLSPMEDVLSDGDEPSTSSNYVQIAAKQMVGIYLSVWVKRSLLPHIRGVQVASVGTGIMGYLGNKGAVMVRLRVYDSGVCLVSAHLSSGEAEGDVLKRNYDYSEIVRRAAFPPDSAAVDPDSLPAQAQGITKVAGTSSGQWGNQRGLLENEHVFWLGDLNYRLTMEDAQARSLIKAGNHKKLAEADELTQSIRQGRAFDGWREGALNFPPTFKFKRGTNIYLGDEDDESSSPSKSAPDQSAESTSSATGTALANLLDMGASSGSATSAAPPKEKRRVPAWTDRILWRNGTLEACPAEPAQQLSYSHALLTASDHRPVSAAFSLKAREFVRDKVDAVVDAARRLVDAAEMAAMPRCELEPTSLDVGDVFYAIEKKLHLVLTNAGQVTANFQFMPLPGGMFGDPADRNFRSTPRWATIEPEQGVLEPGVGIEVILTLWIDGGPNGTADLVACTQGRKLDAILVLRIQDGNDIFLSVAGAYCPSFFGVSLACLASLSRPLVPDGQGNSLEDALASLRIATHKRPKHMPRDLLSESGHEFYSPASSLASESPAASTLEATADFFRQARGRHSRTASRDLDGSLGTDKKTTMDQDAASLRERQSSHAAATTRAPSGSEPLPANLSPDPSRGSNPPANPTPAAGPVNLMDALLEDAPRGAQPGNPAQQHSSHAAPFRDAVPPSHSQGNEAVSAAPPDALSQRQQQHSALSGPWPDPEGQTASLPKPPFHGQDGSAAQQAQQGQQARHTHSDSLEYADALPDLRAEDANPFLQEAGPPQTPLPGHVSDAVELSERTPSSASRESASVVNLVPPELRKLTTYLRSEGRLSTVGLFVNSADHALTVQGSASSSGSMDRGGAKAIRIVREAMDRGLEVPATVGPHDVAATILAFFAALPTSFMPHAAAQVCDVCVPTASAASSLLADALAPVEWAVFRHITSLMRDTLAPGARDANGLTPSALAALLAEVWFAPLPRGFGAAGRDLKPENVTDLQKMAEGVSAIAERRAAFITLFLDEAAL